MTEGLNDDERVDLGEEVRARRTTRGSPVVTVRLPEHLFERVARYAEDHGLTVSELVRQAVDQLITERTPGPTYVSGTLVVIHGTGMLQGLPSTGMARSQREEIDHDMVMTVSH